jgi:hypothetical protein
LQNYNGQLVMLDTRPQGGNNNIGYDNNNSTFGMGGGDSSKQSTSSFAHELDDDIPF